MYFPKPVILSEKIHGHIIEQKRPPLKNANNAKFPEPKSPISMAKTPKALNIFNVATGLSLAKILKNKVKNLYCWDDSISVRKKITKTGLPIKSIENLDFKSNVLTKFYFSTFLNKTNAGGFFRS